MISASLVLAVFFDKNSISQKYAIFASLLFFLAYLGFAFYKITNYRLSFYWGLALALFGVTFIYYSFGDVIDIILSIENKRISTLVTYIVFSMIILIIKFSIDSSYQNNLRYKISNFVFKIVVLFMLIYIPSGIYLNLPFNIMLFAVLLLILIMIFVLVNKKLNT